MLNSLLLNWLILFIELQMELKNKPLVSVIVNCFNSEEFILECINSVLNQSYSNFEILIIDNQSFDNTAKLIFSFDDNRIKYFSTESFISLGEARNVGLSKVSGQIIGFLDSDDTWDNHKIKDSVNKFDSTVGLVYSDVLYFNEKTNFLLYSKRIAHEGLCYEKLLNDYSLCLSSCFFSAKIILQNNIFFDKNLKVCEDYDFFVKISRVSKLKYIPKKLVNYRVHKNNLTNNNRLLFFEETLSVIEKLSDIKDGLRRRLISQNNFSKAVYYWKINNNKDARKTLKEINFFSFKKIFYSLIFCIPIKYVLMIYKTNSLFED